MQTPLHSLNCLQGDAGTSGQGEALVFGHRIGAKGYEGVSFNYSLSALGLKDGGSAEARASQHLIPLHT